MRKVAKLAPRHFLDKHILDLTLFTRTFLKKAFLKVGHILDIKHCHFTD